MNQKSIVVNLRQFTDSNRPFGNAQGKETFQRLSEFVDKHPHVQTFAISLGEIEATDASFPRDSVVSLARHWRGEKGVYIIDVDDRDVIDNWKYAAQVKKQPIVVWHGENFEVLGPDLTQAGQDLLEFVLGRGSALASEAAAEFAISVPSASTRLKKLVDDGYLRRVEAGAESGGIEFKYEAIR